MFTLFTKPHLFDDSYLNPVTIFSRPRYRVLAQYSLYSVLIKWCNICL